MDGTERHVFLESARRLPHLAYLAHIYIYPTLTEIADTSGRVNISQSTHYNYITCMVVIWADDI